MIRSSNVLLLLAIAALGCQRENLGQEQQQERQELAQEQNAERRDLAQDQAQQRQAAAEEAREDLGDQTEQVREQQRELGAANQQLAESVTRACQGIENPDTCPIPNDTLRSTENADRGVTIVLADSANTREEVQRRIECYRARTTLRGTPEANACIIDLADQNVTADVHEEDGHVAVTLTSTDASWVARIRTEARQLLASITPQRNSRRN